MDVASVQLQKNGLTITTAKVEVNMGVPTNPPFECNIIPSTSRPPPTVIWYIGSGVKQISNSTSYTVRASKYDHDKIFYCKAYNRPWNQAVESGKPKLYVRGKVEKKYIGQCMRNTCMCCLAYIVLSFSQIIKLLTYKVSSFLFVSSYVHSFVCLKLLLLL